MRSSSNRPVMPLPRHPLPKMARVRQKLPSDHVSDPRQDVRAKLMGSGLHRQVQPGHRIAITAGSRRNRGILRLACRYCGRRQRMRRRAVHCSRHGKPWRRGSEGQSEILRRLGVSDERVNAGICATMETRELGRARPVPSLTWTDSHSNPTASLFLAEPKLTRSPPARSLPGC